MPSRRPAPTALVFAAALGCASMGCSSVSGSAIPTGPVRLAPHAGPVAIYAASEPAGAAVVGVVEVHAVGSEANVETLLPAFVEKVASVGGDAAVVDDVGARFDLVTHVQTETYTYPCGNTVCTGTRSYPVTHEVMTLFMTGRAVRRAPAARP